MKRLLAILLALVMILSMIPMTAIPAFAEEYLISDEAPVEETPVEETPAEETPVEETPAEEPAEVPAEEAPVEEAPAEEEPVEDPATRNTEPTGGEYSCGYDEEHCVGTVNGNWASVAETGELVLCADNFPDAAFRSYVANNIDTDSNGLLDADELLITEIDCRELGITSLKGVEFFGELLILNCSGNGLGELDLSKNLALVRLYCSINRLTELDLSANTALKTLNCSDNALTELDVSGNSALVTLYCDSNSLTELDLSANTALQELTCSINALTKLVLSVHPELTSIGCARNALTELNLSGCPKLWYLGCDENQLTTLDVSANTELVHLYCSHNNLTALNASKNTNLYAINCFVNQLTELDVSGLTALERLDCSGNALTKLDLTGCTALNDLRCYDNALTQLDLPADAPIETFECYNQFWYGYLPLAVTAEEGSFVADMTGIVDVSKIALIHDEGWAIDCDANTITFDYNPNENGFMYDYATGNGDYIMTVYMNVPQGGSGGDEPGGDEPEYIVLDIPPIEEMTQLFLEEEVVVQWTQEDSENDSLYWFYFIPERDMATTFLTTVDTNAEEYVDPWAYWTDAEGNVITHNDDNNSPNSAIYVECSAEETYFFAVKSVNTKTGPLPVVILEGDHISGGSGGDEPTGPSFADIAPPIEEMTAMELGAAHTANVEEGGYAWFTFTPEVSGTYAFSSDRGNNDYADPVGTLLNGDLEFLADNDDGAGNGNFSIAYTLEAGQTYVLAVRNYSGSACTYSVKVVTAKTITAISVEPMTIPAGAHCDYYKVYTDESVVINPYYYWQDVMNVTLTFSDGTTATGTGRNIEHEGVVYKLSIGDDQSYGGIEAWTAGNTYNVQVIFEGEELVETATTVTITDCLIESITFDAVQVPENAGYWCEEYGEDPDGNEVYYEYFRYDWGTYLNWDVTFSDGTERSGSGSWLTHNGYDYRFTIDDDQGPANAWELGNTYTGTVYVAGVSQEVSITVVEATQEPDDEPGDEPGNDFVDIAPPIEEMTVMEPGAAYEAVIEEGGYAWFAFTPEESGTYSFFSSNSDGCDPFAYLLNADLEVLDENDDAGSLNFSLTYELEAGQTYVLAARNLRNDACAYTVQLAAAKTVTAISVEPISIPEGTWAWYDRWIHEDGTVTYQPRYYWKDVMEVTLTFSDGNTATGVGTSIQYDGVAYSLDVEDTQGDNGEYWTVGNTYPVAVMTADGSVATETTVTITKSKIKSISVEDIILAENSVGEWMYDYDEETDTEVEYFRYEWVEGLKYTITLTNGKKISGSGYGITYDGNYYPVSNYDEQWNGEHWLAGNTYTATVCIAGIEETVNVTIRGTAEDLEPVHNLRLNGVTESSIKIAWDKVNGAERYEIYLNGAYWGNTTKTSYTISGLELGEGGWIQVVAAKKIDGVWYSGPIEEDIWARTYKDISDYYAKLEYTSTVYDGTAKQPTVTLKTSSSGKTVASEAYVVEYADNTGVGQALVAIYGIGNYGGTIIKDFKILPQQVTGVEVVEYDHNSATITFNSVDGADEYWVYKNGDRVAKIEGTTYTFTGLSAGKTYKFSVKANAVVEEWEYNKKTGNMIYGGEANYTGKASEEVSVKPVYRLEDCSATIKYLSKAYTGKKITNSFTVKNVDGKSLKKDKDYTVSYEDNVEMGTATAILKGKGKYAGEIRFTFDIGPKAPKDLEVEAIDGTSAKVTFKAVEGAVAYRILVEGKPYAYTTETECVIDGLIAGQKYSITVSAAIAIGDHVIYGAESKADTVTPRHSIRIADHYIDWDFEEYHYMYYTGKTIKPGLEMWINRYGDNPVLLKEGVDYTVSYKNTKNVGVGTMTIKGKGAYTGSRTVELVIIPTAVTNLRIKDTTSTSVTLGWTKTKSAGYYMVFMDGDYIGKTTSSSYKIKDLVAGEDHEFSVISVKIPSKKLGEFWSEENPVVTGHAGTFLGDMKVSLEKTEYIYDGTPHEPAVTVKTSSKSSAITLVEGVDYEVTYIAVVGPGKAGVIIEGIGQYAGIVSKTFEIVPGQVQNMWAEAMTTTKMYVTWDEVPGATEYWVYVNGSRKKKVSAEETFCTISGLKKGKTYKVTVKAVADVFGEDYVGEASEVWKCYMIPKDQV